MAEINVTPLVDVMLVLLVVFMITAPMMRQSIDVHLPKTSAMPVVKPDSQLIVTITAAKEIFVDHKRVSMEKFVTAVVAAQAKMGTQDVVLEADQSLRYGYIASVIAHLKSGGVERVSLATEVLAVQK
jgi:biopolymer transport protein ExbD